jgi:AcrR family transcriptional regulator
MVEEGVEGRQRILENATRLFSKHGFLGLSMREIAAASGVSKAAIYYHFRDKEELFTEILRDLVFKLEEIVQQAVEAAPSSRGQISALVHGLLAQPVEQRRLMRLASQEVEALSTHARREFLDAYHIHFTGHIEEMLSEGMARQEVRVMSPAFATWMLLGMLYPIFFPSDLHAGNEVEHSADELVRIFFDGVGAH